MEPDANESWATKARMWVSSSPIRIAIVAVVAISAVALGALVAAGLNSRRGDVGGQPQSPTAAAASPSPTALETATPSPLPSASPSPTTAATAPPPTATPVPTELRMTGTWQPLPSAPDLTNLSVSGAVLLADGRIAVTHHNIFERHGDCLVVYVPDRETWESPNATGRYNPDDCFGSDERFNALPGGRLYSISRVIDPTTNPWQAEYTPWRDSDVELPSSMGTTTDGRLYGPLNYCGRTCVSRLYDFDVESGVITQVSEFSEHSLDWVVGGAASRLFIGTWDDSFRTSPLASYDPASGEWREERVAPFRAEWYSAVHGPDGWIYAPTFDQPLPGLWARQPETGHWYKVELPPDLPDHWSPALVDGGDGRLYAFDPGRPYVFTPTAVAPVPIH